MCGLVDPTRRVEVCSDRECGRALTRAERHAAPEQGGLCDECFPRAAAARALAASRPTRRTPPGGVPVVIPPPPVVPRIDREMPVPWHDRTAGGAWSPDRATVPVPRPAAKVAA